MGLAALVPAAAFAVSLAGGRDASPARFPGLRMLGTLALAGVAVVVARYYSPTRPP